MTSRQHLTLTIKNLQVPELDEPRDDRYGDIEAEDGMDKFQVKVLSDHYVTPAQRNGTADGAQRYPQSRQMILNLKILSKASFSEFQPTIPLTRKKLGTLAIAPDKVPAGSKTNFTITYKAAPTEGIEKRRGN